MRRFAPLLALTLFCLSLAPAVRGHAHAAGTNGGSPSAVWGQPNFASGTCLHPTARTLCGPAQATRDRAGNLWVADFANNRVVMYRPGSSTASKVFGQYGSFTTTRCNERPPQQQKYPSAPSRYTLCEPVGVAVDASGTLYVADSINNRVMVYFQAAQKRADAPADRVLGQPGFHATASNDVRRRIGDGYSCPSPHPASPCTLNGPMELSLDPAGDLLVPDFDNNRVLQWSSAALARLKSSACAAQCPLPASRVWGQYGSFAAKKANNPVIPAQLAKLCTPLMPWTHPDNACTLSGPWAAIGDGQGNLYVSDTNNNRVLEYDKGLTGSRQDATAVYGQDRSLNTANPNLGGISSSSLWHPIGLALDPAGSLWITDFYNKRVLRFPPPDSTGADSAVEVLGQDGHFDTNVCGFTRNALCGPTSIAFDVSGDAFVVDGLNSRMLEYAAPGE